MLCTYSQMPDDILAKKEIGEHDLSRCEEIGATIAARMVMALYNR